MCVIEALRVLICWVSRVTPVFVLNRVCHRGIARAHLLGFPGHSCVCFKSCVIEALRVLICWVSRVTPVFVLIFE